MNINAVLWALVALIPGIKLVLIYVFAFTNWPRVRPLAEVSGE